jgi:hypothetical protein
MIFQFTLNKQEDTSEYKDTSLERDGFCSAHLNKMIEKLRIDWGNASCLDLEISRQSVGIREYRTNCLLCSAVLKLKLNR